MSDGEDRPGAGELGKGRAEGGTGADADAVRSRARVRVDTGLLLGSLVAAGAAVAALRLPWARGPAGSSMWALLVASGLAAGLALRRIESWLPEAPEAPHPPAPPSTRRRIAALLALGAATLVVAGVMAHLWPDYHRNWHGTVLPWLAALALAAAAGSLFGRTDLGLSGCVGPGGTAAASPAAVPAAPRPARLPRGVEVAAFLVIAALALAVRVHRLDHIPGGIYVDETNGALDALYILEGRNDSPFGTGWYGTPSGYLYYMAGVFKLLGANWYSLKLVSLLPAFLTVLAIYPLGRLMFGPVGGLSAMAFLGFSRWHMSMSRWGWNEVAPPLFQVLATFFLLRGMRDRRSSDFVAGGLISGLMMYTYLSSRLALATLGVFAVYALLVDREGPLAAWRRHWRGLLLFLLAWAIAVGPIAVTHITEPFTFSNRVSEISVFRDIREQGSYRPLWLNLRDHLRFFHQIGDVQGKHNLPEEPETDPVVGILFVAGLGYALWRLRDPRRGLLWLWLLFALAGGVFSSNHESPQSYRTLNATPALALLAAAALEPLGRAIRRAASGGAGGAPGVRASRRGTAVAAAVVAGACAATAVWETRVYFGRQAESNAVKAGFNLVENGVARDVLAALARGDSVFLSPRFYAFSPLRFLAYGVEKRRSGRSTLDDPPWGLFHIEQDLPLATTPRDTLVLLDAQYWPLIDYLRLFYPNASIELARGPDGMPLYVRARLRKPDIEATQGLVARFHLAHGADERRVVAAVDGRDLGGAARVVWSGAVRVERAGRFDLRAGAGVALEVDGQPWTTPRFLSSGMHDLDAVWSARESTPVPRLEWTESGADWIPVPSRLLFRLRQPDEGLLGIYYPNATWQGEPTFTRLTPILMLAWIDPDPIPGLGQFSARFVGRLRVDIAGRYGFRLDADDGATLAIDGATVGRFVINQVNTFPAWIDLGRGEHAVEIRYYQLGGGSALQFTWQPPGRPETLVPPDVLLPPLP